jgi:hypothetical protein
VDNGAIDVHPPRGGQGDPLVRLDADLPAEIVRH